MIELLILFVVAAVLGVVLHFVDSKYGEKIYCALWSIFHKDSLSGGNIRGFIVGKTTRQRLWVAGVLALMLFVLLRMSGEHGFIILLLISVFVIFPGFLIGFAIGGLFKSNPAISAKAEVIFSTLDKVESGDINLGSVAGEAVKSAAQSVMEAGDKLADMAAGRGSPTTTKAPKADVAEKSTPVPKRKPPVSVAEAARQFKNRR